MKESGRPRLLYLAFYFPPTRASGVHRSLATANHFTAAGWDVTVMTAQREFFRDFIRSYDPSLEAAVSPDVTVERVPFPGWRYEPDVRNFSRLRGNFPRVADKVHTRVEQLAFPEPWAPWILPTLKRARELHQQEPFDVVLATGNPHAAFATAWGMHKLHGVPFVIDYRDSWTLNLYDDAPAYPPRHRAWKWEARLMRDASHAVFVNDPLREWHQHRYPDAADRMLVLQNGWEPTLLGDVLTLKPHHDRPLHFGYLGTLTLKVPLEEFFAGWALARKESGLEDAEVKLYGHLGYFPINARQIGMLMPLDDDVGVSYCGPVSKTQVAAAYDDMDVLLLMLAGSKYVASGKVYEYMATGKPIVSVHNPENAASDIIRGYPMWFPCADLEAETIRDALVKAAAAARSATPEEVAACRRYAARYTRDAQLAPFEQALRELVR